MDPCTWVSYFCFPSPILMIFFSFGQSFCSLVSSWSFLFLSINQVYSRQKVFLGVLCCRFLLVFRISSLSCPSCLNRWSPPVRVLAGNDADPVNVGPDPYPTIEYRTETWVYSYPLRIWLYKVHQPIWSSFRYPKSINCMYHI